MDCPICHQPTSVLEKRAEVSADRRRRECTACQHRFTTYEIRAAELEKLREDKHKLEQLTDLLRPTEDAGDTQPAALDVDLP